MISYIFWGVVAFIIWRIRKGKIKPTEEHITDYDTPQYLPLQETKETEKPYPEKAESLTYVNIEPLIQSQFDTPKVSFVAIDFETANRRRGSACAIGMSKVIKGEVVDSYVKYLRPEPFEFDTHNTYIHGITADMTEDAPTIEEDWLNIRDFVDGLPLVAHNASFDKSVLEQSLEASGGMASGWTIDCTMKRAKELLPNRTSYKLPDLCSEFMMYQHGDRYNDLQI